MRYAVMTRDKSCALQTRLDNRADHLEYIKSTGVVEMAGPCLDENGDMCGSLIILELPDLAAAQDWASNDPYNKAGLFEDVRVIAWNKVIG